MMFANKISSSTSCSISLPETSRPVPLGASPSLFSKLQHFRGKGSPPTSSSTTTNDCIRRWLTAPRARSSTKQRHLPVRRGGKTLARAQHDQHNEMQTWVGFFTLRSPDCCLEDRVHLSLEARNR